MGMAEAEARSVDAAPREVQGAFSRRVQCIEQLRSARFTVLQCIARARKRCSNTLWHAIDAICQLGSGLKGEIVLKCDAAVENTRVTSISRRSRCLLRSRGVAIVRDALCAIL